MDAGDCKQTRESSWNNSAPLSGQGPLRGYLSHKTLFKSTCRLQRAASHHSCAYDGKNRIRPPSRTPLLRLDAQSSSYMPSRHLREFALPVFNGR